MADKDTPEDAQPPQDPGGRPDGPRSEGSQAARAFPTPQPADGQAAPAGIAQRGGQGQEPPKFGPEAPAVQPTEQHPEPGAAEPAPPVEVPSPGLDALSLTPERPAPPEPEVGPETPPAEASGQTSFESVAEGLFRPNVADCSDTHLITTGRPFKPALSTQRPAPAPAAESRTSPDASTPADVWIRRLRIGLRYAAYAAAAYLVLVLVLILLFRFVNPPGSMLMLTQHLSGTAIDRTWVPLHSVSPALIRSVIVSEDSRFCEHRGIDLQAMRLALEDARRGTPRGASTISMQVTKNLFLWNAKSYVRKVIEIPLTLVMETVWPKERIVEVYLNIAEWGPGVFGAEAAARHHFGKSAAKLSGREAALLAAALPNPQVRIASKPGPRTSRMARVIQTRVGAFGSVARCVVGRRPAESAAPAASTSAATASKVQPSARKATSTERHGTAKPASKTRPDDWGTTLRFGPLAQD